MTSTSWGERTRGSVADRVAELQSMGLAPDGEALRAAMAIAESAPFRPGIFADDEGCIELRWVVGQTVFSAEFYGASSDAYTYNRATQFLRTVTVEGLLDLLVEACGRPRR